MEVNTAKDDRRAADAYLRDDPVALGERDLWCGNWPWRRRAHVCSQTLYTVYAAFMPLAQERRLLAYERPNCTIAARNHDASGQVGAAYLPGKASAVTATSA
jgi:hypothetical protein